MTSITKKRATVWIATAAFLPVLLSFLFISIYFTGWYAITRHQGPPPATMMRRAMNIALTLSEWVVVLICALLARQISSLKDTFGLRTSNIAQDILLGMALGAALVALYGFAGVSFSEMFQFHSAKLASIPGSLTAGITEEAIFRGFVISAITLAGGRRWNQVIFSALAFGLCHIAYGPAGIFWTIILGVIFGAVRIWRKNIITTVIAHTILDLCILPALMEQYFGR